MVRSCGIREDLSPQGLHSLSLHLCTSCSFSCCAPKLQCPNLTDPTCHSFQWVSAPRGLVSSPRMIPESALPIWVSRPCIFILFEGSRIPCRVQVNTAEPPSPVALCFCPPFPTGDVTLLLLLLLPALLPQPRTGCREAGSHSCAREPSPLEERLGVEPFPCHVQGGEGKGCRDSSQLLSGLMGAEQGGQTGK